jgi:hypothetical protein
MQGINLHNEHFFGIVLSLLHCRKYDAVRIHNFKDSTAPELCVEHDVVSDGFIGMRDECEKHEQVVAILSSWQR